MNRARILETISALDRGVLLRAGLLFTSGVALGLVVLGWWLFPVQWTDTDPPDLRETHQMTYIAMLADSYSINRDPELARQRLEGFAPEEIQSILLRLVEERQSNGDLPGIQRLRDLADGVGLRLPRVALAPTVVPSPVVTPPPPEADASLLRSLLTIIGVFILIALAVATLALALSRWQDRRPRPAQPRRKAPARDLSLRWRLSEEAVLGRFQTTYKLGDDGYDKSFNIETPAGEFYGACGIGFSEVIGEGPDKISAFEVWLFDRTDPNNVQTFTKVLMSEYAFQNALLRQKIKQRGEPILVERGKEVFIQGVGLELTAKIVGYRYGSSSGLPPRSYFEELSTELIPALKST